MNEELVVRCPACGSEDLREKNVAYAELRVLGWARDPSNGIICPTDYETTDGADWECQDVPNQYVCWKCNSGWSLDDLTDFHDAPPPNSAVDETLNSGGSHGG